MSEPDRGLPTETMSAAERGEAAFNFIEEFFKNLRRYEPYLDALHRKIATNFHTGFSEGRVIRPGIVTFPFGRRMCEVSVQNSLRDRKLTPDVSKWMITAHRDLKIDIAGKTKGRSGAEINVSYSAEMNEKHLDEFFGTGENRLEGVTFIEGVARVYTPSRDILSDLDGHMAKLTTAGRIVFPIFGK